MFVKRLALVVVLLAYGVLALLLLGFMAPGTFPGADLRVYQQAGNDLIQYGNPYANAANAPYVFQYRYPPLLAMLMPVLGWAPLWFTLLAAATFATFLIGCRIAGPAYLLPVIVLGGTWAQVLLNGNVQPILMLLLALVPLRRRVGAVGLAVATMLKLHPVLGLIWYAARRDWLAIRWYLAATVVLLIIQAPWLGDFVTYYLQEEVASPFGQMGIGLRAIHPLVWLAGTAILAVLAWRFAETRFGWLVNIGLQLVALPRVLASNLALVLAAPIPRRATAENPAAAEQAAPAPVQPTARGVS
jgi:Glycosyltransferase family 87